MWKSSSRAGPGKRCAPRSRRPTNALGCGPKSSRSTRATADTRPRPSARSRSCCSNPWARAEGLSVRYRRMPIEVESPEQLGYDTIAHNLSESSVADRRLCDLGLDTGTLDDLVLRYG